MTRLSPQLPKGQANGLTAIAQHLIDAPHDVHAVIAFVDCKKVSTDFDTGDVVPTARVRRIEVVLDADDLPVLEKLTRRALERRSGVTALPLDLEDELTEIFEGIVINPVTGEVIDEGDDER